MEATVTRGHVLVYLSGVHGKWVTDDTCTVCAGNEQCNLPICTCCFIVVVAGQDCCLSLFYSCDVRECWVEV